MCKSLWDPFLMKKLLKSVICGTREQCTGALFTIDLSTVVGWTTTKKRTEKRRTQNVNAKLIWIQTGTKFLWIKQHPIAWIWDRRFHDGDGDLDGAVVEGSRVVVGV